VRIARALPPFPKPGRGTRSGAARSQRAAQGARPAEVLPELPPPRYVLRASRRELGERVLEAAQPRGFAAP